MKKILLLFIILNLFRSYGAHPFKESYYQKKWCDSWHGIMEYRLNDDTRVDCLTNTYAVEFDFAQKWAESVGQSLYYAQETGKKPAIVLILEKESDFKYYSRAQKLANNHNIQLWYMKAPKENYKQDTTQKSIENEIYTLISSLIKQVVDEIVKWLFV